MLTIFNKIIILNTTLKVNEYLQSLWVINMNLTEKLFQMQDPVYREFSAKLAPNIDRNRIIGVRVPQIRKLAKDAIRQGSATDFIARLPHWYQEENQLHTAIICDMKLSFDEVIGYIEEFLPYVDNWAVCDTFLPKALKKKPEELFDIVKKWLVSEHTYTVRYGIIVLNSLYLDENFTPEVLEAAAAIKSAEYYINMAIAWLFSTACAKQYESALPYFENRLLSRQVHNKAIQKARESLRVDAAHKEELKKLKL